MNNLSLLFAIVSSFALVNACMTADIRPDRMRATINPADVTKGRAIVKKAFEAHGGLERWKSFGSVSATVQDDWRPAPAPAKWMFMEYDGEGDIVKMKLDAIVGRFGNSRIEFLNGPEKGEIWGVVDAKRFYLKLPSEGSAPQFQTAESKQFLLQNIEFFPGVPFYLQSADQVAFIDEVLFDGRPHDRVLMSWHTFEPQSDLDQYIVWFDRETGLISQLQFTVRDAANWAVGVYYIDRYETIQGLVVPTKFSARFSADDPDPIHQYTYEDVRFHKERRLSEILPAGDDAS